MYANSNFPAGTPFIRAESNRLKTETACALITDCRLKDNPVVFATQQFYTFTGYTPKFVIGRNCRFLQGPDTDRQAVDDIKQALADRRIVKATLLNYTSTQQPFMNKIQIRPLYDEDGELSGYASYHKLSALNLREMFEVA